MDSPIKCKTWNSLCVMIEFDYPDMVIRGKHKSYAMNPANLKKFLKEKGVLQNNGEPIYECSLVDWMYYEPWQCSTREKRVLYEGNALVVTEKGYRNIVKLLQGYELKFNKRSN